MEGMLGSRRQPGLLVPERQSPSRVSGRWPVVWGHTVLLSHRPTPHRAHGLSLQAGHRLPCPPNHDPD